MQPNKASTIINADSWKNCEVLVNEHYKRIKHDIINDDHKVIRFYLKNLLIINHLL